MDAFSAGHGGAGGDPAEVPARGGAAGPADGIPVLAGHEVVRPLGVGSAGTVWLVREAASGRQFAAKVLLAGAEGADLDDALARAQKEVRIARARPHDHVLPVHRAMSAQAAGGTGRDAIAILSDYAPGGSLGHLLRVRGRLPIGECITVVAPIAQALAALHAEGTAHGDVSPGNILFTVDGMPMLADFGLGRMVGDAASNRGGTPGFSDPVAAGAGPAGGADPFTHDAARPGRARGLGPATLAAAGDVFSLGAVAWFILTGEPPAPTDQRPPLSLIIEDVPAELAAAIEAALRDDARQRPSAEELARSVLRSARPASVDLAPAVDASVLPELQTRRREPPSGRRGPLSAGHWPRGLLRPGMGRSGMGRSGVQRSGIQRPRASGSGGLGPGSSGLQGAGRRHAAAARRRPRTSPRSDSRARLRVGLLWSAVLGAAVLAGAWWIGSFGPGMSRAEGRSASTAAQAGYPRPAAWSVLPEALRRGADAADPVQAVQALSEIRARAIAGHERELLDSVNAKGSYAASADAALLDRLIADGQRLEGFAARVLSADLERGETGQASLPSAGPPTPGAETAVVRVRIVTSGYTVKNSDGVTVGERPAGLDQELRIILERDEQGWKVARIAAA
ncbi:serine/threonine-protein kinase [Sinomonas sp. ASV486]|uniref:serine/threonine-protein kinase n=1 Tax=Sinomonas sp. ASV486 TaxID=3051170 RepID=UPI0027DE65EF|nr:serine/threonine-protein kinase [Sinomonas sp. ASV486]MDQ4489714.1 serine/threonine-protein kinase [Sinomonas sp. ASV486]